MTAEELDEVALALEEKATALRSMAAELRRPRFALVPDEPPATRKAQPVRSNAFMAALAAWRAVYERAYGREPVIQPRDRKMLGLLLNPRTGLPTAEAGEMATYMVRFLADEGVYRRLGDHPLWAFCQDVNRYRGGRPAPGMDDELRPFEPRRGA